MRPPKVLLDLTADVPPLEAKKLPFRKSAKEPRSAEDQTGDTRKLMFINVKKAHLNGRVPEGVDVWRETRSPRVGGGVRVQDGQHQLCA